MPFNAVKCLQFSKNGLNRNQLKIRINPLKGPNQPPSLSSFEASGCDNLPSNASSDVYHDGKLPVFWLGCSMGGAVACRAAQIQPSCGVAGMVMLAPMISLDKVSQKSVLGPIKNKHIAPIGGLRSVHSFEQ